MPRFIRILVVSILLTSACKPAKQKNQPVYGNCRNDLMTINVLLSSIHGPPLPDSLLYVNGQHMYMPVYDNLFRADNNYRVTSRILKSWKSSDDFKKYTFTLSKGITFLNGKALTINTIKVLLDPNTPTKYTSRAVKRLVKKVIVEDEETLSVYLKKPHSMFPEMLSDFQTIVIHESELLNDWPSGSGPFETCYQTDKMVIIQRRKISREDSSTIQQIRYFFPAQTQIDIKYLKDNDISFFPFISVKDEEDLEKDYLKYRILSQRVKAVLFNIPDTRVRQALASCLDREQLLRHPYLKDSAYKYDFMLANGVEGFANGIPLDYKCTPYQGPGIKQPIEFLSYQNVPGAHEFMKRFIKDWSIRSNVPLEVEVIHHALAPERVSHKKYAVLLLGIGPKGPLADGLFLEFVDGGTPRSILGFKVNEIDEAYEKYLKATPSGLSNAIKEVERQIRFSYVAAPIAIQTLTFYIPKQWENITLSTSLTGVFDLTQLRIKKDK